MAEHRLVFVEVSGCEETRGSKRMMACPNGLKPPESSETTLVKEARKEEPSVVRTSTRLRAAPGLRPPAKKQKCRNLADVYKEAALVEAPPDDQDEDGSEDYEGNESDVKCQECTRGADADRMLLCDSCNHGYHMYCLSPIIVTVPKGDWFCPGCSSEKLIKVFPMVQRKIIDFFRIEKPLLPTLEVSKKRRHSGLKLYKKSRKLIPYTPSRNQQQRLEQMASLATALVTSGVEFSNELTYGPHIALRDANKASLEKGGMQVICREDKSTYDLCKAMHLRGELPPLMVTRDSRQGFVVEASSHIKDMTLIAEYTGDVDYMRNREEDEGDSIMGLLFPDDPSKELVICPDKRGNIARFISGINNHTPEGKKKQNVRCIRFDIDGEVHALLVSIREIAKGERLYYDYNAYQKEYPTEHFV